MVLFTALLSQCNNNRHLQFIKFKSQFTFFNLNLGCSLTPRMWEEAVGGELLRALLWWLEHMKLYDCSIRSREVGQEHHRRFPGWLAYSARRVPAPGGGVRTLSGIRHRVRQHCKPQTCSLQATHFNFMKHLGALSCGMEMKKSSLAGNDRSKLIFCWF